MRIAGLFPGQGSQQIGMGAEFAASTDEAKAVFEEANKAIGFDLAKLCFEGPLETLTLTQNSQPAILTASYACFRSAGISIEAAAGHSLGEYTALVAAGALAFADAVALVHKRGQYMQEAVPVGQGRMYAVMGPSEEEIREALKSLSAGVCEIANLNSPGQTVIAGDVEGTEAFKTILSGAKMIPLNVSAPFHCSLMQPAAERLAKDLDATSFTDPSFPVISNVTARPVTTADEARLRLKEQVCGSVRWTESMENLVDQAEVTHTVEFGPGGVLTKLMKRIRPSVSRLEVFDKASLEKTKGALAA